MSTLQEVLDRGISHHKAGRLADAEKCYRQILTQQPHHPGALHLLGLVAYQVGQPTAAVELIRKAIALIPNSPEAHSNLGHALRFQGDFAQAIDVYRRALSLKPDFAEAENGLGIVLKETGKCDEAITFFQSAIVHRPHFAEAYNNLGTALKDKGQLDDAITAYQKAISLKPDFSQAHYNLGNALRKSGRADEAIACFQRATSISPNFAEAFCNLGDVLKNVGQFDAAITACRRAISIKPDFAEAHCNLAGALKNIGRVDEALEACRRAVALKGDSADVCVSLGNVFREMRKLDEAIGMYRKALGIDPNCLDALSNLGACLVDTGELEDAIAVCRRAIAIEPALAKVHGNILLALQYLPTADSRSIAIEQRRWSSLHAEPLKKFIRPHSNVRDPNRRLRIGYVSPDFRDHVAGRFMLPLLSQHDKREVEVFGYSQVTVPDPMTDQFRRWTDHWRNIVSLSDAQVADQIHQDKIDILVDLALHMACNRILIFARKPAPIQVNWLGYPGSTGLETIDYRLSDPYLDPPGTDESIYTEKTIRLPGCFWCYEPVPGDDVAINALPAASSDSFTFGCLNHFAKVTDDVLAQWAKILHHVKRSRLLLLAEQGSHRQRRLDRLACEGIEPERITFVAPQPRPAYLREYNKIDLSLDTWPYTGHTTTIDSLWMGIPVVSLVGQRVVGRGGLSILSNARLREWAVRTEQDYIKLAVEAAQDLPRLSKLRAKLRQQLQLSALMDGSRFARDVEGIYRRIWGNWCASK